jgi:hypothetical protein
MFKLFRKRKKDEEVLIKLNDFQTELWMYITGSFNEYLTEKNRGNFYMDWYKNIKIMIYNYVGIKFESITAKHIYYYLYSLYSNIQDNIINLQLSKIFDIFDKVLTGQNIEDDILFNMCEELISLIKNSSIAPEKLQFYIINHKEITYLKTEMKV